LKRLQAIQAIQNKQGSAMRDELRQPFALLPSCTDPRIWVTKPTESRIKYRAKFYAKYFAK
jgi:hypothetical protein